MGERRIGWIIGVLSRSFHNRDSNMAYAAWERMSSETKAAWMNTADCMLRGKTTYKNAEFCAICGEDPHAVFCIPAVRAMEWDTGIIIDYQDFGNTSPGRKDDGFPENVRFWCYLGQGKFVQFIKTGGRWTSFGPTRYGWQD